MTRLSGWRPEPRAAFQSWPFRQLGILWLLVQELQNTLTLHRGSFNLYIHDKEPSFSPRPPLPPSEAPVDLVHVFCQVHAGSQKSSQARKVEQQLYVTRFICLFNGSRGASTCGAGAAKLPYFGPLERWSSEGDIPQCASKLEQTPPRVKKSPKISEQSPFESADIYSVIYRSRTLLGDRTVASRHEFVVELQ